MSSVVIVDSGVREYEFLLAGLDPSFQVFVLDPTQDGFTRIAEILSDFSDVDALHVISHGSEGTIFLGSAEVTRENLEGNKAALLQIGASLSESADILLYGCNVAAGTAGQVLVEQLAAYTGADVAASTNFTGSAALGGDWVLETAIGTIEATVAVSASAQETATLLGQTEVVLQAQYPYQTVVYIEATFRTGFVATGSGVLVGPNDVLTAAHMVYSAQQGGAATSVKIIPAYDPSPYEAPFGVFYGTTWHYYTDFDPDGDGILISGNGGPGLVGSELDIAMIDLSVAIGDTTGWMGLDPNFTSGYVNVTGHPGYYGNNMMTDYGYVWDDAYDNVTYLGSIETHPGNSGGPLWYMNGGIPYAIGVVSTQGWGADIMLVYSQILTWINGNDHLIPDRGLKINGDAGNNTLVGTTRNDTISGLDGHDFLNGSDGHDGVFGNAGNDTVYGGAGNDNVQGNRDNDVLYGEGGNDVWVVGGPGLDWVHGGDGNDNVQGNSDDDTVFGGNGNDSVFGGWGNDFVAGNADNDTVYGGEGNDNVQGNLGNDFVYGENGDDFFVVGGPGNDTVNGGNGNDNVQGNLDNDWLSGGGGNDSVFGGPGSDILFGDAGSDTIMGGPGIDTLYGSSSAAALDFAQDRFWFTSYGSSNADIIPAFQAGDALQFDPTVFTAFATLGPTLPAECLRSGFGVRTAATPTQFLILDTSNGQLLYDADGSGTAAQPELVLTFTGFSQYEFSSFSSGIFIA